MYLCTIYEFKVANVTIILKVKRMHEYKTTFSSRGILSIATARCFAIAVSGL